MEKQGINYNAPYKMQEFQEMETMLEDAVFNFFDWMVDIIFKQVKAYMLEPTKENYENFEKTYLQFGKLINELKEGKYV